jgi:hypothetical protein
MSFRAWVVLLLLGASAQAAPLKSGLYEGLMLAVAPDGAVQGHYLELQGRAFQALRVFPGRAWFVRSGADQQLECSRHDGRHAFDA